MYGDETVRKSLLGILEVGLLRIRAFGTAGDADSCSAEADHLHNIPKLIDSVNLERISYYYNVERSAFLSSAKATTSAFEVHWTELKQFLDSAAES